MAHLAMVRLGVALPPGIVDVCGLGRLVLDAAVADWRQLSSRM